MTQEIEALVCCPDDLSSIPDPTRCHKRADTQESSSGPQILALAHLPLHAHVRTQTHTILLNLDTPCFQVTNYHYIVQNEHFYLFLVFFSHYTDLTF